MFTQFLSIKYIWVHCHVTMMSSPQFRNFNRLLMFLIKIQLFDLTLYIFPSTVQWMPLPFSTQPDCLPNITHLHSFKCVPLNEVPRSLHYLYCICVVRDLVLGYRQCLYCVCILSCPIQIRPPASPAAPIKQSASHCLANYSDALYNVTNAHLLRLIISARN